MAKVVQLHNPPEPWIVKLAESLIGTASEIESSELETMTPAQMRQFDSLVFRCEGCGWWHSADDKNQDDGLFCDDCMANKLGSL